MAEQGPSLTRRQWSDLSVLAALAGESKSPSFYEGLFVVGAYMLMQLGLSDPLCGYSYATIDCSISSFINLVNWQLSNNSQKLTS